MDVVIHINGPVSEGFRGHRSINWIKTDKEVRKGISHLSERAFVFSIFQF